VAAASDLLTDSGVDAVTLRGVGDRAGVSRTAPYRHFRDKQDLLAAVAVQGFTWIRADVEKAIAAARDGRSVEPLAGLQGACVAYIRGGLARPEHYRLMFGDQLAGGDHHDLDAAAGAGMAFFLDILAEHQRAGLIRPMDVTDLASLLWAFMHGLIDLSLAGHLHAGKGVDVNQAAPRLVAEFLAGLATDRQAESREPRP
jgi:AcrR family transcriptional regulator